MRSCLPAVVLGVALGAASVFAQTTTVPLADGLFTEWSPGDQLAPEAGGSAGQFVMTDVWATSRGTVLFVRFDTGIERNLQSGSSSDGRPALHIDRLVPDGQGGETREALVLIDFRARAIDRVDSGTVSLGWDLVAFQTLPTFAATEFECTIDLGPVGIQQGDRIAITFGGLQGDADAAPFELTEGPIVPEAPVPDRHPSAQFRLASINTWTTGLPDPSQGPKLARLIDGVDADVYCFQEEYNSSASQLKPIIDGIDPLDDGASWNVHQHNDCVIASSQPVIPIPSNDTSFAAAIVDLPGSGPIAVFTNHPKCCGYYASSEDTRRVDQMNALMSTIESLRTGGLGFGLQPYADAPVVLVGDWNLVGWRNPLTMVEDPSGPDLAQVEMPLLGGNSAATWFGSSTGPGSFMPGRLDLMVAQRDVIAVARSFGLDSRILPPATLTAMGIQSGDSSGSDHLMLVADLAVFCPGDVDGDQDVDIFDFAALATNFGAGPSATRAEGDLTLDGMVNVEDFADLASRFGSVCGD